MALWETEFEGVTEELDEGERLALELALGEPLPEGDSEGLPEKLEDTEGLMLGRALGERVDEGPRVIAIEGLLDMLVGGWWLVLEVALGETLCESLGEDDEDGVRGERTEVELDSLKAGEGDWVTFLLVSGDSAGIGIALDEALNTAEGVGNGEVDGERDKGEVGLKYVLKLAFMLIEVLGDDETLRDIEGVGFGEPLILILMLIGMLPLALSEVLAADEVLLLLDNDGVGLDMLPLEEVLAEGEGLP